MPDIQSDSSSSYQIKFSTADQLLLINQWVDFYKKIPVQTLEKIKKEVGMELVETTISEHIFNLGKVEGKAEGFIRPLAKLGGAPLILLDKN